MINKSGGSSHDPQAKLGPQMWDRPMQQSVRLCGQCQPGRDPAQRPMHLKKLVVTAGPAPGVYHVCQHCDIVPWPGRPN